MKTGAELIGEIDAVSRDSLAFFWLGQHSFVLKIAGKTIWIDPYLTESPKRLIPPFLLPEQLTNADIILGTHDHSDHIDRPSLPAMAAASPGAPIVIPEAASGKVSAACGIPMERIVPMNDGRSAEIGGVRISAVASAHEFLQFDSQSGLYPFLGYVIEYGGFCVYHPGDCCAYDGWAAKLGGFRINLAFLPINGRDAARYSSGCMGNMTFQEAADFAGIISPDLTIPTHYDMFANNRENPKSFIDYMAAKYPRMKTCIPKYARACVI